MLYNLTGIEKIVKIISRIKRMAIHIKCNPSLLRQDEMDKEYGSYSLIKNEFNWTPKITLAEGLAKLLQ